MPYENSQKNSIVTSYTNSQGGAGSQSSQNLSNAGGTTTLVAIFNDTSHAERAVSELRRQGFTQEEISIVSKKNLQRREDAGEDDITDGALTGGALGGLGGLLIGTGALAIPGIGPIIAAGPIAAALSGAVAGGITGGLIDWGIPAHASRQYEEEVSSGNILAIIQTKQSKVSQASALLNQYGAVSVKSHSENQ